MNGSLLSPVVTDEEFLLALPLLQELLTEEGSEYAVALHTSAHLHSWKMSKDQGYSLYLCRDEDQKILAVIGMTTIYDPVDEKPFCRINNFFIIKEARNQGLGKAIMQEAEGVARKAGAEYVVLEVAKNNASVQEFYHKQNYVYACDRLIKNIK